MWKPLGNRWKNSRFLVANKVDFSGGRILPPLGLGFRVLGCKVRVYVETAWKSLEKLAVFGCK